MLLVGWYVDFVHFGALWAPYLWRPVLFSVTKILEVSFRYGGGPLVTTSTLGETDPLIITFDKYKKTWTGWE